MKILVTGKNGQLGQSIKRLLDEKCIANLSSFSFIFTGREELNLENLESIQSYFVRNDIDVIINCAAYTKVDQAEEDQSQANLINHNAVRELAKISKKSKIKLIHISTDYVFNGHKKEPYTEDDIIEYCQLEKGKLVSVSSVIPFHPIEVVVAMTKHLHMHEYDVSGGKWVFSRLELERLLRISDLQEIRVQIQQSIGTRLTKSILLVGEEQIGKIYFSMVSEWPK